VRYACQRFRPDIVLHLAAKTNLDHCEQEHEDAFRTNAEGTRNVALVCQEINALLVHFSTSSVFSGESGRIYTESDEPQPRHVHGRSKWEGERFILQITKRFLIIRPAWMFGGFRRDKKLIGILRKQIANGGEIWGVTDKIGSPTYAFDCLQLTRRLIEAGLSGTFHVVNSGYATRFDMAQVVAQHHGASARQARSDEFPSEVLRPDSEMLSNQRLASHGLAKYMGDWRLALKAYLEEWDKKFPISK
jgi:dTDP-4-dehydrorhamnose reductase